MNIILKMASLVNMTESGCADQSINGSFQNQEEQASTSGMLRRSRKQSPPICEPLLLKKAPRVTPRAGVAIKRVQHAQKSARCFLLAQSQ